MPELRLHYTTVGEPSGEPVLVLHGTTGSAASMLTPAFAGELFGAGQPLDASKYFIILPDAIGHGKSSKPSDGLRAKFPHYNYDDMVEAQYRLVTEGLGISHLRLVIGNSMGGMHTWMWGVKYPDFMDALVPMASQPTEMSSRNWMMRRLIIDSIRNDPDWKDGNYTTQPQAPSRAANVFFGIATNGGTLGLPEAGADAREGRQAARRAAGGAVHRRRQRHPLPVGIVARLQPLAGPGAHPGRAAGDQLRRRRAQSAGDRPHGARAQAREERPPVPDPGQRGDARPRHDRHGEVLEAATAGVAPNFAVAGDVGALVATDRTSVQGQTEKSSLNKCCPPDN